MADVTFSSIHVVSGQELGDTPQVFVQLAGKRAPRAGETLILFLDLPSASAATCTDVARTLSEGYWRAPGGMTTALRLAVKLANDRLVELNRGVPAGQRAEGSLTCAVVSEESVIIAQSGPAIAFARAQTGAFERVVTDGAMPLVGSSRLAETFFTHFAWKPGDTFVLTGTGSCASVSEELINACMAKGDARMVAGYLNANIKEGHMTGVVFAIKGQPTPVVAAATARTPARTPAAMTPAPLRAPREGAPVAVAAPEQPPDDRPNRASQVLTTAGAAASTAVSSAARSVQRSMGAFGAQLLPASPARAAPAQRSRATVFGLASAAILVPIAVALVVSVLYFQWSGEAEKQQLRTQTQGQVELAKSSPNKDSWAKALSMINDYAARYPDEAALFQDDVRQGKQQIDQINKITRVTPVALVDLAQSNEARRIAAASLGVYVLDTAANRAEYHVLNVQRSGVTGKPVPLTPASGVTTTNTDLRDVSWATTSGGRWRTEGAMVFSTKALYEYSAATGQMTALNMPVDTNNSPGQVTAGELYNNTAYVLDNGVGQIWRYQLQAGKLVRGDTYFRSPFGQLKDSVDIAIDGSVYLLQKTGTVLKYFNRQPTNFTINASTLPEPMGKVIAIAVNGPDSNNGSVFIADAAAGAVWQFNKAGEFVKQYRGANDEFVGMQDMSLDPTSNTIYVNTAGKLFSFKVS